MLTLGTSRNLYHFCSTCRSRMVTRYFDGDVENRGCPDGHESLISYKTYEGLKRYALKLFQPAASTGIGAKEDV